MSQSLVTLPPTATVEEVVAVIERDGGVIIADFVDSETLASIAEDLSAAFDEGDFGVEDDFAGTRTRRACRLFARVRRLPEVALHPIYHGAAQAILQQPYRYWFGQQRMEMRSPMHISLTQGIEIHPGQGAQPLHRDDFAVMWRHPDYGREARVQLMLAVTDFTAENGGTLVIPGSHQWDDERMPMQEEAVPAVMDKGSALIWIGSVFHAGGNNLTDSPRTGLTIAYDVASVKFEENHLLSLPIETVQALPEQIQRYLGWDVGENFMGYVELNGVMSSPFELLADPDQIPARRPAAVTVTS